MKTLLSILALHFLLAFVEQQASAQSVIEKTLEVCGGTQPWAPIQGGLPEAGIAATVVNDSLYLLCSNDSSNSSAIMFVWDGSVLRAIDTLVGAGGLDTVGFARRWSIEDMQEYQGELYICGSFRSVDGVDGTGGCARWDGSQWTGTGMTGEQIWDLHVYEGMLYAAGYFVTEAGDSIRGLGRYDGQQWTEVAHLILPNNNQGIVTHMVSYHSYLVIHGAFGKLNNYSADGWMVYDGVDWTLPAGLRGLDAFAMEPWNDTLYISRKHPSGSNYLIQTWNADSRSRTTIASNDTVPARFSLVAHDNYLYTSGDLTFYVGDSTYYHRTFARYDGSSWEYLPTVDGQANLVEYNGTLIAYGKFTRSCGTVLNNLAFLCDENNCGHISGTIYREADGDCVHDTGEQKLHGRIVEINPGGYYVSTDSNGYFSQPVLPGSYTVATAPYLYWRPVCPSTRSVSIAGADESSSGNDFSMVPIPGIHDLRVSVAGGVLRPGFGTRYTITYANVGTEAVSSTLRFDYDDNVLMLDSAVMNADRSSAGSLEWDIASLQPGEGGRINVWMTVGSGTSLGTTVCSHVRLDMGEGYVDTTALDNRDSNCIQVRGSYDPNDITVTPEGGPSGDVEGVLRQGDTVLAYRIRFQNTGTDTAFRVVIRDTLDPKLDIPTIAMGAGSHDYTWKLEDNGVLVVTFDNIMLPDSNVDRVGSNGYVKYTVHLRRGLAAGSEIANRASIYFDFNSGVLTNQVISITPFSSGVPLPLLLDAVRSYPRPAAGELHVEGVLVAGSTMRLRSTGGAEVLRATAGGSGHERIDLKGLPAGVYLLEMETRSGRAVERVVIAR